MSKQTKFVLPKSFLAIVALMLLFSSTHTASFAGKYPNTYQQRMPLSAQHLIEVATLDGDSPSSSKKYSLKVFSAKSPKLISARTRTFSGHISEVIVEDINNDSHPDVIVMMEDQHDGKPYLVIDTFHFDGKQMAWKQQLPTGFISVKTNSVLQKHEFPHGSRNTAILPLDQ